MANTEWTNEQRDAIFDRGHNLLVSAAAGSGKTAVLVERIISLIKEGKANIDEMLIATFTNAAAAEMREKILKRLQEEDLNEQTERIGHASISSLDSFANSVVKRYYHVIGLDPALKTCDATSSALLKEDALDEMFEAEFNAKSEDFRFFLDCYDKSDVNDEAVRQMILNLHRFLMTMPRPWEYASRAVSSGNETADKCFEFAKEQCTKQLELAEEYHKQFIQRLDDAKLEKLSTKARIDLGYVQSIKAALESNPELGFAMLLEPHKSQSISFKKTELEAEEDKLKAIRKHAVDLLSDLKAAYGGLTLDLLNKEAAAMQPAIKIYFDLVKKFDDAYTEKKRLDKSLDFSDMNHFALQILENEDVRREYQNQYKYVFIDEYQDTNSVQEELISRVSRADNLFMVGDVKQSIYKFRLAEPEIFLSCYDEYKSHPGKYNKLIDLNKNFRSKDSVIDSVNTVFSSLMTRESCDIEYDDAAALKKGSPYDGPVSYPAELRILDSTVKDDDDDLVKELAKAELEALQAAAIIREFHGKTIHDDKSGADRKLDYKDMVILMRGTRNSGEVYYKTLLEANIPVYLDRSEGYFDSLEIQVFLNLLKLISNSKSDIPLLSVLCCPVFGFSAEEIAKVRIYGNEILQKPKASFSEVFYEYAETDRKAGAFVERMNLLRKEAHILPLADFIYKLLLDTGYGDFASAQNAGEQKLANLKALVDKAEKFEKDNLSGLAGFIRFAETLARNSKNIDIGPAKTLSESANCVRIMTIHKSKGLEFPFVLVSGLVGSPLSKLDSTDYAFHKELGCAIKPVNPKTRSCTETKLLYLLNQKKSLESEAEEIRILYVAFTRAIDILILSACKKISEKNSLEKSTLIPGDIDSAAYHLDLITPCMPEGSIKYTNKNRLAVFVKQTALSKESFRQEVLAGYADAYSQEISDIINYPYFSADQPPKKKYSVSELAEKMRTGKDHYRLSQTDEEEYYASAPQFIALQDHKLTPAEKGTAYHNVMEHIPFCLEGKSIEEIESFVKGLVESNILTKAEADCIEAAKIKAFFDSEIGQRACSAKELHKEAPFVMKHKHEGYTVLVQGTIDCYFEEDGEYVLVDYKSNYIDLSRKDEEFSRLKESYLPQLSLYKEALEKICGKKVKEAVLYLIGTGDILKIE